MIEKVNPSHPDKVADRIAGAIVDLAYTKNKNPKIAVEVLIGHHNCKIIIETDVYFNIDEIIPIVERIADNDIQIEVIMAKHRGGSTGTVKLAWMPSYTKFANLETRYEDNF